MKILYIMHIDIEWIKQRPHFMAEELNESCEILVLYRFPLRDIKRKSHKHKFRALPLIPIPFRSHKIMSFLDDYVQYIWVKLIKIFFRFDVVYITFPDLYAYVYNEAFFFDCMDNSVEFYTSDYSRKKISRLEGKCLQTSRGNIFSSDYLFTAKKVIGKANIVVRNGISRRLINENIKSVNMILKRVLYFGTISHWMDFDMLVTSTQDLDIEIHLVGPIEDGVLLPSRFVYHNPMNHEDLIKFALDFSCFIMPFKINDLILGVDPVKLYEYISLRGIIISIYYPELNHFADFIHFYTTGSELRTLLLRFACGELEIKGDIEREKFLRESTWDQRACEVFNFILELENKRG